MSLITVGYLSYITEKNEFLRFDDFQKSLNSLNLINSKNVDFISIDNNSIEKAKEKIRESKKFSKLFHYKNNFFDVSMYYTTMWYAKQQQSPYICFLFDDFIVYDDAFDDVIKFMDQNPDVSCVRIPAYDYENKSLFDADITPKSVNPDSVRHYNTITKQKLNWIGPITIGNHNFYKNNWHYTSRPIVWKRNFFEKVMEKQGNYSKILQGFEGWATKEFNNSNFVTGVLDKGMVKTTPVDMSARGLEISSKKECDIQISINELFEEYQSIKGI